MSTDIEPADSFGAYTEACLSHVGTAQAGSSQFQVSGCPANVLTVYSAEDESCGTCMPWGTLLCCKLPYYSDCEERECEPDKSTAALEKAAGEEGIRFMIFREPGGNGAHVEVHAPDSD